MATWIGIGSSRQPDSFRAGHEAAQAAVGPLGQRTPDFVLAFASSRFDQQALLQGITSVTGRSPLAGCSTAGEILSEGPVRRSVAVMAIRSDSLRAAAGLGLKISENPRKAGQDAATQAARAKLQNPHGFLMFPDGLTGNAAEAIRGVQDVLGTSFPIAGGSAADDFAFQRTHQYFGGTAHTDAVPGVLLCGAKVGFGIGARHGWKPLGKPRRVTRASANVVQELDGHTAVNLYETYFGQAAEALRAGALAELSVLYPLGMPIPGEEEYLLRNVLRTDPSGALVYAGEISEGSEVRLMMGSKEKALEAARRAAEQAVLGIAPKRPAFALVFSSCSRARLFGPRAGEEILAVREVLGRALPMVGFYDYGEQAPLTAAGFRGLSYFHNETLVVCAVAAP